MKNLRYSIIIILIAFNASRAAAEINETLTFTNFTDEELYVELSIFDDSIWYTYDLYVLPNGTSIADYWADSFYATYSACAYGEFTGDFYGCIDGNITDYYNNIYFDLTEEPYKSTPSELPSEVYVFESPYNTADVVVIETDSHHGTSSGCFLTSLFHK